MSKTATLNVKNRDILETLQGFLKSILETDDMDAVLVPMHRPGEKAVMPVLISNPEYMDNADPLAPSFPINAAKLVSRLTRKPSGGKMAVVLRPCEIRAFIELVKLKQANTEDIIIIGTDCLGAYGNNDYSVFSGENPMESTRKFTQAILADKKITDTDVELSHACRVCEHPVAENADIAIGLFGVDIHNQLLIQAKTEKGEELISNFNLKETAIPSARKKAVDALITKRKADRDEMFKATSEVTASIEKLSAYLSGCVNCYNCRVACPVCYCRECVFVTDVFDHDPSQYLQWAERKGGVTMPTDTLFYHITRIAHISLACVGCGQCSNACPNDISLVELFRTLSYRTQTAFDYEAGRSLDENPPLSEFFEEEYANVVGIE
ncbi:MAG: Coenzyme F420 hydrogenase/dehydrogenase, beta subunit C-terminal domain [Deltaproteobacteria bacterium]|nr:Coenzyme F420 hydrogenase/dehydrogenase, beta subunit C-terminal domain [Deltaproteobacteria bacterium]MBW1845983.1 Coenzyme F420 hydrogenase/dehydrogenase, beta subunit C-terminal domain [Deltaproteobacteria bacterium]MBW1983310.1 Coenzyme F420 hydrogenase/dehydrogenase, beta subunit C-terminal domain [Deltaproteobacteria bacterium]